MMKNRLFWIGNMAGAVAGWIFIVAGFFMNLEGSLHNLWGLVTLLWVVGHPLELIIALPIARKAGFTENKASLNILVYGITWWIPVKLGVFKA